MPADPKSTKRRKGSDPTVRVWVQELIVEFKHRESEAYVRGFRDGADEIRSAVREGRLKL